MNKENSINNMIEIDDASKHQYLILEIGREKESYFQYFYNDKGVNLDTFTKDFLMAVKQASGLILEYEAGFSSKEIDDFYINFEASKILSDFGYHAFTPHSISFTNMGFFGGEFDLDTSARHLIGEDELLFDFSSENDRNVFVYSSWNGLNESLVRIFFFRTNNNLETAHDIIAYHYEEVELSLQRFEKSHPDIITNNPELATDKFNEIVGDFDNFVKKKLNDNGFNMVPFHKVFAYCRHSLSEHLEDIIGAQLFKKLVSHNNRVIEEKEKDTQKFREKLLQGKLKDGVQDYTIHRNHNTDDDLPF